LLVTLIRLAAFPPLGQRSPWLSKDFARLSGCH
jgi:hypothetical protein